MLPGDEPTDRMKCMEVWGGNASINRSFAVTGLRVWLYSLAHGHADQGGDVYYISSCASGRITRLLLADVSGHGSAVAGIATGLRDLMRRNISFIKQTRFVHEMNQQFAAVADTANFATAIVCTYFSPTRTLQFCNAGHPVGLLYRAKEDIWTAAAEFAKGSSQDGLADTPLGVSDEARYSEFKIKLSPGDRMLCVSDAFTEASDRDGRLLGSAGLLRVVARLNATSSEQIIPSLVDRIGELHADNLLQDDATALLFEADGSSSSLSANLLAPFRWVRGARDAAPA